MSPPGPSPDHLRVATWNVNSLRARTPALGRFIRRTRPDVILLQETKANDVAPEAAALFAELGYEVAHAGAGPVQRRGDRVGPSDQRDRSVADDSVTSTSTASPG